jgi:hypothetical protein
MATPKQVRTRGRLSLLLGAIIATVLFAAVAYADDISNNLDATVDGVAEVMPLTTGGADGTTRLYVVPQNGDGKNGCNFGGTTGTLTISLASSNIGVATVSPSSVTFTGCVTSTTGPIVTVHPVAQGTATISATITSNGTGATFNVAPVTFTANVAPPPNTAPHVSVTGVVGGATYNKGSVPSAGCSVTDAEDGPSSFAATLGPVVGPYASDGIGEQEASCSYTDEGGITATASVTYGIVDPSAPVIDYTLTPATPNGDNGWYTSNVGLTWDVSEPQSPNSLNKTGCVDQNIMTDQGETSYSCSATSAGGSTGPVSVSIKRDATAPTITASRTPANGNGWNNEAVTVNYTCNDATSGVASCGPDETLPNEGENQSSTGTAVDNAGNSDSKTVSNINIDLTDPLVSLVGGPAASGSYYFGSVPAEPTCNASDALSGLAGSCSVSGYSAAVGTHTVLASASDKADNSNSVSRTYTVLPWTLRGFYAPVDMGTSVVNTVKNGSTVPLKFEIFVGSNEVTDTAAVTSLSAKLVPCTNFGGDALDDIEVTATGGTSLRYDSTGGQFIYNWKTPTGAGKCIVVTMTTDDGSKLSAQFKTK